MDTQTRITNDDIVALFKKALAVMEVENANPFRIRAYQNAIAAIQGLPEQLYAIAQRNALDKIPAIGSDLTNKINEILDTGTAKEWEKLFSHVPAGMFSLLDIPGIGPKRAYALAHAFGLTNPDTAVQQLAKAAEENQIQQLEGFGEKLEEEILQNLKRQKPKSTRMRLDEGEKIAQQILTVLQKIPEVKEAIALGSLRRREETVGDVDIGVATNKPEAVLSQLESSNLVHSIQATGNNVVRLILHGNKQADIKFQTLDKWGATLQHFTGSKFHNIALREYALQKGMSLSEHGIKHRNSLEMFANEQEFYSYMNLDWIPPELRQNTGEIEAAINHSLPKLVSLADIQGDLHTHTNFEWVSSHDYGDSVEKLLDQADALGYNWLALGDHNPSQTAYSETDMITIITQRHAWIDEQVSMWQQRSKRSLNILKTLEVDILPNGELPLSDAALELFDCIIVSVHSRMLLPSNQQTARLLSALNHPKVKIVGHPTGRLINERQGIQYEWDKVFAACLEKNVALEINAHPARLDLPDNLVRQALQARCKLSINSDAHAAADLTLMHYGVDTARRGWAPKSGIINTYTYKELTQWINS